MDMRNERGEKFTDEYNECGILLSGRVKNEKP